MRNRPFYPALNAEIQQPAAADWLWRPWYAKLWWAAIPIYWAAAAASLSNGVQKGPPIGVEEGPPFRII
ncbi:MAG: hypothetical protein CVT74_18665 [Alphaproteobacteria bacterium HGW-Alphaproteobacteria-13]|jgi:hypothetical protein|nr:MAG: hypothetical protein CVT74_18665 [Alphaproteobacteria bacterium HGW-Alphaproteobacteria-13]